MRLNISPKVVAAIATAATLATAGSLTSCASSSSSTAPRQSPSANPSRSQAYSTAIAEVNQYLAAWRDGGAQAAAKRFKVPAERGPDAIRLSSGKVVSFRPERWLSAMNFTLLVILDLHFVGSSGAWNPGPNGRFITFTRALGQSHYLMYFATSP